MSNDDTSFAGGSDSQENLRYKVGCETDKQWTKHRLQYERKGLPVECLRRGYGLGQSHKYLTIKQQDDTSLVEMEESSVEDTVQDVEKYPNIPPTPLYNGDSAFVPILRVDSSSTAPAEPVIRFAMRGDPKTFLTDDDGNPNFATILDALDTPTTVLHDASKNRYLGLITQFHQWEESLSVNTVLDVFSKRQMVSMFDMALKKKSILFALYDLSANLERDLTEFCVCEVDFLRQRIVFYGNLTNVPEWYQRIVKQQFVLPGEENLWRIVRVPMLNLSFTILALLFRIHNMLVAFPLEEENPRATTDVNRKIVAYLQKLDDEISGLQSPG